MAETEVKKRPVGRPRKKPIEPVVNEQSEKLNMSSNQTTGGAPAVNTTLPMIESLTSKYGELYQSAETWERIRGKSGISISSTLGCLNALNPFLQNQRLKQIYTLPQSYDTENIIAALNEPQNHELLLRGAGWNFSANQPLYDMIIRQAADVPLYKHYLIPELIDAKDYNSNDFREEGCLVEEWVDKFHLVSTLKQKALEIKREGKCSYSLRTKFKIDEDTKKRKVAYAAWQKLPSNYVKLTGVGELGFTISFNMMLFMNPAFCPDQYSDYIRDVWDSLNKNGVIYKNPRKNYTLDLDLNKAQGYTFGYKGLSYSSTIEIKDKVYMFWVQIPQELCYTFCSDNSHPWAIPDTSNLFLALKNLDDYKTLASLIASTPLSAILTGQVEYVDGANTGRDQTKMNPETLIALRDTFNMMTSTNVEAFFAPLKDLRLQTIPNTVNSSDILSGATSNFVSNSGEGGLIVTTDKPSIAQIKGAQLLSASRSDFVTRQFEDALNYILHNLLGFKYKWTIKIFGNIYTQENDKKFLKEAVLGGAKFFLPKLLAYEDISIRDSKAIVSYVDTFDLYKGLETLTQEKQAENKAKEQSATIGGSGSGAGRPTDENSENDSTAASQEQGSNISEIKDVYSSQITGNKCKICGAEISEDEDFCEECIERWELPHTLD